MAIHKIKQSPKSSNAHPMWFYICESLNRFSSYVMLSGYAGFCNHIFHLSRF